MAMPPRDVAAVDMPTSHTARCCRAIVRCYCYDAADADAADAARLRCHYAMIFFATLLICYAYYDAAC